MNKIRMMELVDEWSTAGFEEGKYHSEYGKGVFHEKYASPHLSENKTGYLISCFDLGSAPADEALKDLNKILEPEGYAADFTSTSIVHVGIRIERKETKNG